MESMDKDWRATAREEFFERHKSIGEIARITGISRPLSINSGLLADRICTSNLSSFAVSL